MEKYDELPANKKEKFEKAYRDELAEFTEKKKKFFADNPDLKGKKKKRIRDRKGDSNPGREPKKKKQLIITPLNRYREILREEGNVIAYNVAQNMWKSLPIEEKGKIITEVANMETDEEKKITKEELKIMEKSMGVPSRAMTAYNIFCHRFKKKFAGSSKEFIFEASKAWKSIDEEEKASLQKESDMQHEEWRTKMIAYIKTMPKEQQPLLMSKHNLFNTSKKADDTIKSPKKNVKKEKKDSESSSSTQEAKKSKKRKANEETNGAKSSSDVASPKKKKKISERESSVEKTPKKKNAKISESSVEISPVKKAASPEKSSKTKESSPEKSPKKKDDSSPEKKSKKQKSKEPVMPSQSTAHFFMSQYEGKPGKIAKAYKNLDGLKKAQLRDEMRKQRAAFFTKVQDYIQPLAKSEIIAFQDKMRKTKEEQKKAVERWHVDNGTDVDKKEESSSDSSDDSDSS
jgi:hypothetical protein